MNISEVKSDLLLKSVKWEDEFFGGKWELLPKSGTVIAILLDFRHGYYGIRVKEDGNNKERNFISKEMEAKMMQRFIGDDLNTIELI